MPDTSTPYWYRYTCPVLLAVLFFPLLPALSALVQYMLGVALGCLVTVGGPCLIAGVDLTLAYTHSVQAVNAMAHASTSVLLLFYVLLLTGLVQLTIRGFRGRVVRTCAVIMCVGVMPLVLNLLAMATGDRLPLCDTLTDLANSCAGANPFTSFAYYGNIFFHWLADIAVPLAVLVSGLVALTLGYRALIGWLVRMYTPQE